MRTASVRRLSITPIDYTVGVTNTPTNTPPPAEVWLRGRIEGIDPWLTPVAHALIQAKEDIERLTASVSATHAWSRPGGAASIGFHVRHIGGATDRLFTYARGEQLTDEQKAFAKQEGVAGEGALSAAGTEAIAMLDRALAQLRGTSRERLLDERKVGRAALPSNVIGLLFHAAEHATRHVGQAVTTAKILAGS